MSLYNFIYKLQRKPESARRRILFGLLAVSFLALAAGWVFMFKNEVSKVSSPQTSGVEKVLGGEGKILSPLAALAEGFKGFKDDIAQKIGEYRLNESPDEIKNARPVYELPK